MKILTQVLLSAALLYGSWAAAVRAADQAPFDLLQAMSAADFRATGLDHLSDAQVQALSAWFRDYQSKHPGNCLQASPTAANSAPDQQAPAPADEAVASHLMDSFNGWSNGKHFKLDNGQEWVQIDDTLVSVAPILHAKVRITSGAFNAHYLSVEGMSDSVLVRLVKP